MIAHIQQLEKRNNREKRAYLKETLSGFGTPFQIQKFKAWFWNGENIIVDYPSSSSKETPSDAKKIFLTAHYDTVLGMPGANDNASGVAVLLEVIERFMREKPSGSNLRIIFFDKEEGPPHMGLHGSENYVRAYGTDDIDRLYNLEMVGRGNVLIIWRDEREKDSPWIKELVHRAAEYHMGVMMVPPKINIAPFLPVRFISDHFSFIRAGFLKAYCLTTIPERDTAFARRVIIGKKHFVLLFSALRYYFMKRGDFPEIIRHYHNRRDRSEFLEPDALKRTADLVCDIAVSNNSRGGLDSE